MIKNIIIGVLIVLLFGCVAVLQSDLDTANRALSMSEDIREEQKSLLDHEKRFSGLCMDGLREIAARP